MEVLILILHVLLAMALVGLVLLQQGKGADAGASFGAGASQTVFGSSGAGNFLSRTTAFLALGLFITSFTLAIYAKHKADVILDAGVPGVIEIQPELPKLDSLATPTDTDVPTSE
jgi:preprotein translocase subunit SecG